MGKGGQQATTKSKVISWDELAKHRTPNDAWLAHKGKVYDVSGWEKHPGGSVIFTHAGDDCTDIFAAFHPGSAFEELSKYEIGVLDEKQSAENVNKLKPEKQKQFEQAYRDLRAKLVAAGMFNASYSYYFFKVTSNFGILALAIACAVMTTNFAVNMLGACLLALFWQQSGWLAHDFLHHQVFKTRMYGDLIGIIIGNICQGFSVQWWKSKHNSHHAVPNLHASTPDAADGDPDIDTMPLLAWSIRMAESAANDDFGRFMISYQAIFYFPILFLARLSWAYQSVAFVFQTPGQHSVRAAHIDRKMIQHPTLEKLGLIIHYAWLLYVMSRMPLFNGLMYFLVSQTVCGLLLAIVFGLGHNGMAVYPADERPDFWKLQVSTSRNVTSNLFVDWFCGGLQYQVEHHLFPSLPRHNLGKVHKVVEQFCKEQGVEYHEAGIIDGNVEVLKHLSKISKDFAINFPAA